MIQLPLIPYVTVGERKDRCPSCYLPDGRHDSICREQTEAKAS